MGIGSSIFLSSFSCLPVYLWGKKEMEKEKSQGLPTSGCLCLSFREWVGKSSRELYRLVSINSSSRLVPSRLARKIKQKTNSLVKYVKITTMGCICSEFSGVGSFSGYEEMGGGDARYDVECM